MARRPDIANFLFWFSKTFDEIMFQDDNERGRNKTYTF